MSPFKMPISKGNQIFSFPELRKSKNFTEDTFKVLPGLLADSLPDKNGNRLINAWLVQQGRTDNGMNPIENLCFIGKRGRDSLEFDGLI